MKTAFHPIKPEVATSSLTLAAEVFAQWQAGKVVVMNGTGIMVDGNIYKKISMASSAAEDQDPNTFQLKNGKWIVRYAGIESQFKDSVGFKYTHLLLVNRQIPVSKFISVVNYRGADAGSIDAVESDFLQGGRLEGMVVETESNTPAQTAEKHKIIRAELARLGSELQQLRQAGNYEQTEELEKKIEFIENQLQKMNFKGFDRTFSSQYKRDLDSVRIAVNRAIKSIGSANPTLAWHLTVSIKFGAQCLYRPEKPTAWNL